MTETPTIGDLVADRYEVLGLIEEAPAYTAFRARDQEVEVDVALWWMKEALFATDTSRDAFIGAVVDVRGLNHRHLRRIFEAGRRGGGLYLTTQLASHEGPLLRLGSGRRPPEFEILRYATALAGALEAAHKLGHVHGLLIPTDLVQVAGQIKVGGVGLYRDADPDAVRASFEEVRRYLAPELLESGLATPASDVYSAAAILSELASGVSEPEIAEATEALASAEQLKLADVLAQALSRAPERRPKSPQALLDRIRRVLVDDRVPTAEQAAAMPPTDPDADLEAPTVRDAEPVSDLVPTTHFKKLSPAEKEPQDEEPSTDSTQVETEVARPVLPRPEPEPEPPTERDQSAAGRRARETYKIFGGAGGDRSGEEGQSSVHTETVIEKNRPRMRAAETIPDELPPPPAPPPSTDSATARLDELDLEEGSTTSADQLSPPRKPSFISMKPVDEERERRPRPIAAIDRPEMQPKLRPLGSVKKSVPPGSLGHYAPPRAANEARPPQNLARKLWILVGVVAVLVAVAVLATWILVGGRDPADPGPGEIRPLATASRPGRAAAPVALHPRKRPGKRRVLRRLARRP